LSYSTASEWASVVSFRSNKEPLLNLTSDELLTALVAEVPGTRSLCEQAPELWNEKPPNHYAVFGELLQPYLFEKLRSPGDEGEVQNLFEFFEKLAGTGNAYFLDLLLVEIIEPLNRDAQARSLATEYAGTRVRNLMAQSAKTSLGVWFTSKVMHFFGRRSKRSAT
jgi:hypothetical protein